MAGVRRTVMMSFESTIFICFSSQFRAQFPPTPIPSMGAGMAKEVIVTLKHQDRDGHVKFKMINDMTEMMIV